MTQAKPSYLVTQSFATEGIEIDGQVAEVGKVQKVLPKGEGQRPKPEALDNAFTK